MYPCRVGCRRRTFRRKTEISPQFATERHPCPRARESSSLKQAMERQSVAADCHPRFRAQRTNGGTTLGVFFLARDANASKNMPARGAAGQRGRKDTRFPARVNLAFFRILSLPRAVAFTGGGICGNASIPAKRPNEFRPPKAPKEFRPKRQASVACSRRATPPSGATWSPKDD